MGGGVGKLEVATYFHEIQRIDEKRQDKYWPNAKLYNDFLNPFFNYRILETKIVNFVH